MFLYASNHPKKKAQANIKNGQDLTPINLAAKLGRKDIFTKILEINVVVALKKSFINLRTLNFTFILIDILAVQQYYLLGISA